MQDLTTGRVDRYRPVVRDGVMQVRVRPAAPGLYRVTVHSGGTSPVSSSCWPPTRSSTGEQIWSLEVGIHVYALAPVENGLAVGGDEGFLVLTLPNLRASR